MQSILNHQQIEQKITRLAHQIIENSFGESTIFLGGICGNGVVLAEKLKSIIESEGRSEIILFEITVDKENPLSHPIELSIPEEMLSNAYVVLADDVINSGKTMQYALTKILENSSKAIKTVALVDRMHRRFPIKADFVGLSLSTTLKERVEVFFEDHSSKAVLI